MPQTAKKHDTHAFSQFRLTNKIVNNLSQFELTPTTKLVLVYLTTCYNPNKADMFPKQKTIAAKLGISEASVIRAISELHKEGLIISERKYTLRYKFTSKIVTQPSQKENFFTSDILQGENSQNEIVETCNLQRHDIEPMNEHKKEPAKVAEYKILKEYAERNGAKNITAYINSLKKSGAAAKIIQKAIEQEKTSQYWQNQANNTVEMINQFSSYKNEAVPPTETWKKLKAKLWG